MVDSTTMTVADDHFTVRLPTKRVAADCLIFDPDGRVLIVEPTYKSTWDVPGGVVEVDESPRRTAQREVFEELGLEIEPGSLLAVDWVPPGGGRTEVVAFLFDAGTITRPTEEMILQTDEIRNARFVSLEEAKSLMSSAEYLRLEAAVAARPKHQTIYLENGQEPEPG